MKNNNVKIIFLWLKIKFLGALAKFCRIVKKTIVYQSKTGLKEINPRFSKCDKKIISECFLSADDLYLGIDFLKDKYSLIDVPIGLSPHFELMKALFEGRDVRDTQYVQRMLCGALDERYEIVAFYLDKNYFRKYFTKRKNEIENGNGDCVVVYNFNGRYYIHDGKHRAALSKLMGVNVKCKVISFNKVCADFNSKKIKMITNKKQYAKHQKMFNDIKQRNKL